MAKKINCNVSSDIKATIRFESIVCMEKVSGNKNIIFEETFSPETSSGSKFPVSLQIFKEINRPGSNFKAQVRILGVYSPNKVELDNLQFSNAKTTIKDFYKIYRFEATHPGSCTFEASVETIGFDSRPKLGVRT